ncbi:hypothetical protein KC19_2G215900 [Ceratodon purpureus]|uniref:Uncharacterized protein n=1 Tax=Ceratodon purpureus TaxID=3225 RepID=A0A8T0IYN2_CERPU|nr:hypothetical protein KC19_2G215900 [Ceratodon purpureus]
MTVFSKYILPCNLRSTSVLTSVLNGPITSVLRFLLPAWFSNDPEHWKFVVMYWITGPWNSLPGFFLARLVPGSMTLSWSSARPCPSFAPWLADSVLFFYELAQRLDVGFFAIRNPLNSAASSIDSSVDDCSSL